MRRAFLAASSALALTACAGSGSRSSATPASAASTPASAAAPATPAAAPSPAPRAPSAPRATPAAPASNDPVLQRGDSGDAVRILQDLLNEPRRRANEPELAMDGQFGPGTEQAVKDFQTASGLGASGVADARFWTALEAVLATTPLGTIDPLGVPLAGDRYRRGSYGSTAEVEIHVLPTVSGASPLLYETSMAIDADGAGTAWKSDPSGQPQTSLTDASGASLDPTITPYFVLPLGFAAAHPGVALGDVAAVFYRGQVAYAIFGDEGPRGQIGEGSIALATALGINPSPTVGGVETGVTYIVFPGSGSGMPLPNAEITARASALLQASGGRP